MSRIDPFAYALAELAEQRFPAIREESVAAAKNMADRGQFASLPTVQRMLLDVETPQLVEEHPEAAEEYLNTLYVAYRYWDTGRHLVSLDRGALEAALEDEPEDPPTVPHGACYVQLPERWCWAQVAPDEPHEPLDGLFIVAAPGHREITVLAVLGLRADRPGFSEVTVVAVPRDLAAARAEARTPPFAPVIAGGDAAGIRSLVSTGELLHLAHVALHASGT
ncbi:MAG: hypothetical protein JSW43_06070 [Gemmatimonadota bacterium]|nr:MAG: hypothetical protein JSW43_06070 [Gemmatimonadota bacterium]